MELSGAKADEEVVKNEISEIIGLLIKGGAADLDVFHPVIPELRNDSLSLAEARADADFGMYIPETLPKGFGFETQQDLSIRSENTVINWTKGMGYIDWHVSLLDDEDKTRIISCRQAKL